MAIGRVLVSGAGGFIGRWSVPALHALGYEVHAVRRRAGAGEAHCAQLSDAQIHSADLLDERAIDELLGKLRPTHLLHYAWIATPGEY
jgi:uncharacterized protein YbjT (DUF2867 family)